MRSSRCPRFEKEYKRLTKELQKRADNALERFEIKPYRNSLRFKQVAPIFIPYASAIDKGFSES